MSSEVGGGRVGYGRCWGFLENAYYDFKIKSQRRISTAVALRVF
jgi:hypothetical protein